MRNFKVVKKYIFILPLIVYAQTHFTVPDNVWKFSMRPFLNTGDYIGQGGTKGINNQPFGFSAYAKRFFDHTNIIDGYYASTSDLVDLDTLNLNSTYTVGEYIRYYNQLYNDSIPEMSVDFFGTDSLTVMGILNQEFSRYLEGMEYNLQYGISDRITFELKVPYYTYAYQKTANSWSANTIDGLDSFIQYHEGVRSAMDSALVHHYSTNLQLLYNMFYDWEGSHSLLWAMKGDPFQNGFFDSSIDLFTSHDTLGVTFEQLLDYYNPEKKTNSGIGDVELGLKTLLFGKPSWSEKGVASLYGGVSALLATADRRHEYSFSAGTAKKQAHFTSMPLGDGASKINLSLFGELYKTILRRNFIFHWLIKGGVYGNTRINTPISFIQFDSFNPDSIASTVGTKISFQKGNELWINAEGYLELIPDWVSVSGGFGMLMKGRDRYYSNDTSWNQLMRYRKNDFDTRVTMMQQYARIGLHNVHPLKRIGPIPFELTGGYSFPFYTRNAYQNLTAWIQIDVYAQSW